jgi:hypothetical protein
MANELLAFSTILRESMSIFENACVAAKTVNRRYESKIGDFGETFYVPIPETPIVSDGPTLDLKDTAPTKVAVTLDKQKHTDFTFTSKERLQERQHGHDCWRDGPGVQQHLFAHGRL